MIAELVVEAHGYQPVKARQAAADGRPSSNIRFKPDDRSGAQGHDLEPNQLERDIAEIERAAEALRKGEPDLEPWTNNTTAAPEPRKFRSVWFFVGTIGIATVLVTGAATLAITSLLCRRRVFRPRRPRLRGNYSLICRYHPTPKGSRRLARPR